MSIRPLAAALLLAAGCGYSVGPDALYAHRSVRVVVADNVTERRTHEFDLTQVVIRQLQAAGLRVNADDATARVLLTIADIREPTLVEGALDVVTVASVSFRVQLTLVDVATGRETQVGEHAESATVRGQTRDTARAEVFDRLARWVASKLEKEW